MTRQSIQPGATLSVDLDALGMNAEDRGPGKTHHRNPPRPARLAVRRRGALAAAAITVGAWMLSGVASAGDFYLRAGIGLDRPAALPASSVPVMATGASAAPQFTSRSRLTWLTLLPGLKVATRYTPSADGARSCMLVRNPSDVRM